MKVEQRNADGSYQRWDLDAYLKYRRECKTTVISDNIVKNHPMLGRKFSRRKDVITITKIVRSWHAGYYYTAVFEVNGSGSHGVIAIQNINSISEDILDCIKYFKRNYKYA